jgi:hypothetical protein
VQASRNDRRLKARFFFGLPVAAAIENVMEACVSGDVATHESVLGVS